MVARIACTGDKMCVPAGTSYNRVTGRAQCFQPRDIIGTGGKSELRRARRSSAATGGNPKESATERETVPIFWDKGEKVR